MAYAGALKIQAQAGANPAVNSAGESAGQTPADKVILNPSPQDAMIIQVKNLFHTYGSGRPGETAALSGVNLDIRRGEYVAIAGPNGSGKSTLARHFNALLLPSEGQVLVDGLDTALPENVWEIRRRVGMVFQNPDNQIVSTLVEEDVAFGAENLGSRPGGPGAGRGSPGSDRAVPVPAARPHLLSGGQKQRLALAGVLAMRPSCLVLDEPTAMLDPAGRRELLETLQRLNRTRGATVVQITHYMEEAALAGRVIVMAAGKIALDGPPEEVFANAGQLEELGLELPAPAEIARGLKRRGFFMPGVPLTTPALVQMIKGLSPGVKEEAGGSKGTFFCFLRVVKGQAWHILWDHRSSAQFTIGPINSSDFNGSGHSNTYYQGAPPCHPLFASKT